MTLDEKNRNERGKIDFVGKSVIFSVVSGVLIIIALAEIFIHGLNYGIDFSGGTEIQVQFLNEDVSAAQLRKFADEVGLPNATVQAFGEKNEFLFRFQGEKGKTDKETNEKLNALISKVTDGIKAQFSEAGVVLRRVDSVGPQIGDELKRNSLLAAFYCLILILVYVGLRFDYQFAPGAVICLFHDSVIALGILSLLNKEINVQIMAAVLTIIGYSLNDTIVTFDRIRENVLIFRDNSLAFIINRSINDVLSRTILTSLTTLIAVGCLYFFAGGVIEDFAFTLGIGIIVGTYSSIYVASPLVLVANSLMSTKKAS